MCLPAADSNADASPERVYMQHQRELHLKPLHGRRLLHNRQLRGRASLQRLWPLGPMYAGADADADTHPHSYDRESWRFLRPRQPDGVRVGTILRRRHVLRHG